MKDTSSDIFGFHLSGQVSSVTQPCPTLCDPMNRSTPGLPVHHQLPEFTQTHVHRVGDGIWNKLKLTHRRVCLNSLQIYNFTLAIWMECCDIQSNLIFKTKLNTGLLLLLLLSRVSRVWLCVTPRTEAYQASLSLGFSRQEHWSRLPFPSPMHESEKWKWSHSIVSDS